MSKLPPSGNDNYEDLLKMYLNKRIKLKKFMYKAKKKQMSCFFPNLAKLKFLIFSKTQAVYNMFDDAKYIVVPRIWQCSLRDKAQ